jgi:hypothetical protein
MAYGTTPRHDDRAIGEDHALGESRRPGPASEIVSGPYDKPPREKGHGGGLFLGGKADGENMSETQYSRTHTLRLDPTERDDLTKAVMREIERIQAPSRLGIEVDANRVRRLRSLLDRL